MVHKLLSKDMRLNILKKSKRFLALTLASLMVISTPLSSYAGEGQAGGIGGGGDGSSASGGSGGNSSFRMNQQGYRFTIVDSHGKAVSKTIDIWKQEPNVAQSEYLKGYKTSQDDVSSYGHEYYVLSEFVAAIQTVRDNRNIKLKEQGKPELPRVETPETAMSGSVGSPILNGEEFKKWMLKGVNMTVTASSGGGGGGENTAPQKTVTKVKTNADGSKTTYYSDGSSYTSKPPKKGGGGSGSKVEEDKQGGNTVHKSYCLSCGTELPTRLTSSEIYCTTCVGYYTKVSAAVTRAVASANNCRTSAINNPMTKTKQEALAQRGINALSDYNNAKNLLNDAKSKGRLETSIAKSFKQTLDECQTKRKRFVNLLNSVTVLSYNNTNKDENTFLAFIDKHIFGTMTVYAAETNDSDSGESVDGNTSTEAGVIKDLVEIQSNGKPIFEVPNMKDKQTVFEAMAEHGYTLIVEPLLYEIPWSYQNGSWSQYVAGTPTNLAEWAVEKSGSYYWLTGGAHMTLLCKNFNRSMALDKDYSFDTMVDEATGTNVIYNYNVLGHTLEGGTKVPFNELVGQVAVNGKTVDKARAVGYGCHVYYPKGAGKSAQHTYDVDLLDQRGPAPDPSTFTPEIDYKEKSKNIKIEKYYEDFNNATDKYEPVAYFGRNENPHTIAIDDEEPVGYSVADWFTSTTDKVPPENGDIQEETFKKYKDSYNNGKYKYDEALNNRITTITILPEDNEIVLHVLLQQIQPVEVDIVKVYDNTNGTTDKVVVDRDVEVENGTYYPPTPDNGYNYTEATTTPDKLVDEPSSWNEVPKTNHTTNEGVPVPDTTNTIYIHYIKDPTLVEGIVLHQNEISRNFDLTLLAPGAGLAEIYRIFDSVDNNRSCPEDIYVGDDSDGNPEYDDCGADIAEHYSNSHYSHSVFNDIEYPKDFVYLSQASNTDVSDTANSTSGFKGTNMFPNLDFTVQRAYNDKVTFYPGNNAEDIAKLKDMGFQSEGYKPANTRYNALKESEDIEWNNTFKTNWTWTGVTDPTGYWECTDGHFYGNWSTQNSNDSDATVQKANNTYSRENNTKIKAFLGKANEGLKGTERNAENFDIFGKTFTQNKSNFVADQNNFEFYPYILMNFETLDKDFTEVNVTSENLSKVKNTSNIDVGVYKNSGKTPLELSSTQWSTHARTQEYLAKAGITDKNIVLPGGAIYDIKGSNASGNVPETWVGLRSFEMSIPDSLKIALDKADGIKTTTEAKQNGKNLHDEAKEVLDNYQIVQWVASGVIQDRGEFAEASDITLVSGDGAKTSFGGNRLSTDSKYYLREGNVGSSRSDIDILEDKFNQIVYRIYSNTSGKVTVTKDGVELISEQLDSSKNIGVLLANKEVKLLENKTHVVSNFVSALDIGLGSDRQNKKWFNEAFDGIEVVVSEIAFNIGFADGNDVRSSALDTKLVGKLGDRRDLYNFEDSSLKEKTRTSQFKTSKKSTSAKASGKAPGYVGSLNGVDVILPNVENLLYTKVFFIPNANVTDLN